MKSMRNAIIGGALMLAIATPSTAFAFRAWNNLPVNPEGQFTFEVIQRGGGVSAADVWCAAGDYALRKLGVAANQQIFLIEGKHAARTETRPRFGYSFSLTPPPEAQNFRQKPILLNLNNIGDSLSAAFAQQYCFNSLGDRPRRFPY